MPEVGSHILEASMQETLRHYGAADRAVERAHDTHRLLPDPPETPAGILDGDHRNPAQTDRTPRS